MSYSWSNEDAKSFWQRRKTSIVFNYIGINEKVGEYTEHLRRHLELEEQKKSLYIEQHKFAPTIRDAIGVNQVSKVSSDIKFWCCYSSWTFCSSCNSLKTKIMPHNMIKRPQNTPMKTCMCKDIRYVVPRYEQIPHALLNLSKADIHILRPFHLKFDTYERQQHGYRVKCCPIKLLVAEMSVEDNIDQLTDEVSKSRCLNAYKCLMSSENSSYRHFVELRECLKENNESLNLFNFQQTQGIECALWPNLYPFTKWCESTITDSGSRLSSKVSFNTKLLSEIVDYGLHFDLLQFQYDRWLYKTVSGAVNTARRLNCSPARALETKFFSATFWQWQHRYILDAVDQFGLPDVFVTISPYEWSFPFPKWLEDIRLKTSKGPTQLAGFETAHVVHVLAQVIRGYLCGSNSSNWSSHVFSYNSIKNYPNVKTYFYRFEFQQRGTAHLHLLVWLNDITKIKHEIIRADIPKDNPDLSYLVSKHQQSDKPSSSLKLQEEDSYFQKDQNATTFNLKHPADAFECNLRAYIATLLPALECSMDFQTTDNRAMLLKYVTSYVTKWQDGIGIDGLYSHNVSGGQAAIRFVMDAKPAEPEMWLALSSTKISWSCSRTKRYAVPTHDKAREDQTAEKYRNRPANMNEMSLLDWLRSVDHAKEQPKEYKNGSTLVGLKLLSIFNSEYFFQYLIMHKPHRHLSELQHPLHDKLPLHLQWFASAKHHCSDFWEDDDIIADYFHKQGNRDVFITTVLAYIHTLADSYFLLQMQILSPLSIDDYSSSNNNPFTLDIHQKTIQNHILSCIQKRTQYYSTFNPSAQHDDHDLDNSDEDDELDLEPDTLHNENLESVSQMLDVDWKVPAVVTGDAGCGKSYTIKSIVNHLVRNEYNILVAAPTGLLAAGFKASLPDEVTCDTVHASFHYPVQSDATPSINWHLSNFDLIVIDEISMLPQAIFQHILKTLNVLLFRPVFLLSGDAGQQQPFARQNGKTMQLPSAFDDESFLSSSYKYRLRTQHRIGDSQYFDFLNHVRNWVPTQEYLDELQEGRVFATSDIVNDSHIMQAYSVHADCTILTFTKCAANRANEVVINSIFQKQSPIAILQLDCDLPPINIYVGMRVVITQNRNKACGVINGQLAYVHMVHNNSVFLQLPSEKIVAIYPVTVKCNGTSKTLYAFAPAYATTICKAQGQTLTKAVVWFDIDAIPPGTAYVALSRVKCQEDIYFMTKLKPNFFTPVTRLAQLA